jgi:polysaccharide export outer membrane protein
MASEPTPPVTLKPGDEIELKFYNAVELNDIVTVLPDGTVNLQLVGQVVVDGRTPAEVREELISLYATQLKVPEVAVIPRKLYDRRVYVGGEVLTPGVLEMPGRLTVLEAIMEAGGFDLNFAQTSSVIVIRQRDGKRYGCALDLRDDLEGRGTEPFYLQQHDIVFVPRTPITRFNSWVDQYINRIIGNIGFIWTYNTQSKAHTVGVRPER